MGLIDRDIEMANFMDEHIQCSGIIVRSHDTNRGSIYWMCIFQAYLKVNRLMTFMK